MAKDKAHHDHARLISLDGRTEMQLTLCTLSTHQQGVVHLVYINFSVMCGAWASQREIEKLIAVCYCTARLIVRIHNIRVRALCENKLQLSNGSFACCCTCGAEKQCHDRRAMSSRVTEKLLLCSMGSCSPQVPHKLCSGVFLMVSAD